MIAIINGDMLGHATEPGEYIDWNAPDIATEETWADVLGCSVAEYAETNPHMIIWVEEPVTVSADDAPGFERIRAGQLLSSDVIADVYGGRKPIRSIQHRYGRARIVVTFQDGYADRGWLTEEFKHDDYVVIHARPST